MTSVIFNRPCRVDYVGDRDYQDVPLGKDKTLRYLRFPAVLTILIISLGVASVHLSADPGKKHKKDKGEKASEVLPQSEEVFSQDEIQVINHWSQGGREGLPPGLAKKDRLPPGLEKQLYRRGTLPPGLQKKIQPVPVVLERQLRILPTGYRRVIIGGHIVIMNAKTSLILDVARISTP